MRAQLRPRRIRTANRIVRTENTTVAATLTAALTAAVVVALAVERLSYRLSRSREAEVPLVSSLGFLVLLAVWVVSIVFSIMAAVAANRGEVYKYPLTIAFIK